MIEKNISLKAFNTFGFDEVAEEFTRFDSCEKLAALLKDNKKAVIFF